jgi:hypothetical protein
MEPVPIDPMLVLLAAPVCALVGAALGAFGAYLASSRQASAAIAAAKEQAEAIRDSARRQVRASTIVASRQKWIDELRADLSTYSAILLSLQMALEKQTVEAHGDWLAGVLKASTLEAKIALLLNPGEEPHEALLAAVMNPLNELRNGKPVDWGAASLLILDLGRPVLKEAWDKSREEAELLQIARLPSGAVSPNESLHLSSDSR